MRLFGRGGREAERRSVGIRVSASVLRVLVVVFVVWCGMAWWVTNRPPTEEERQRRLVSIAGKSFGVVCYHAFSGLGDAYYEIIDGGGSPLEAGLSVEQCLADAVRATKKGRTFGLGPLDADAFYFDDDLERWMKTAASDEPYILLLNRTLLTLPDGRTGYLAYVVREVRESTYDGGQVVLTAEEAEAFGGGLRRLELP